MPPGTRVRLHVDDQRECPRKLPFVLGTILQHADGERYDVRRECDTRITRPCGAEK